MEIKLQCQSECHLCIFPAEGNGATTISMNAFPRLFSGASKTPIRKGLGEDGCVTVSTELAKLDETLRSIRALAKFIEQIRFVGLEIQEKYIHRPAVFCPPFASLSTIPRRGDRNSNDAINRWSIAFPKREAVVMNRR
jgi:hypothetical protein